jgi:RNA polymerase sigma-70 factor (ECF subfamily)
VSQQEDYEVIKQVIGGDANAFELLIERHKTMVFSIVGKHVPSEHVAETAQEVFVRAFFALKGFRQESPFTHWLGAIATRTSAFYWRQKTRQDRVRSASSLSEDATEFLEAVSSNEAIVNFENSANQAVASEVIERVLEELDPQDRILITLLYFEDKSVKEVSQLLGISVANVKVRGFRARKRMKRCIEQLFPEGDQ